MSTTAELPKPLRVSPLIKFGRWSFLTLGIFYGAFHNSRFARKEAALREKEAQEKPMRDAKLAEEKRLRAIEEQKMIDDWSKPTK